MKLTLRTLLAYLDDMLEPAQAREIGARISEVKEAEELVAKIQDVIRRRRIGAPELAGPGSGPDPNLVADYLENVLPPEQVVELEQLCRRSDIHLAEVAACHKILTMVLGQPMTASDDLRQRMYVLGIPRPPAPETAVASPTQEMTEGMGNHQPVAGSGFEEGLPEYLKQGQGAKRFWTTVAVLLLAVTWIGLIISDPGIWSQKEPADDALAINGVPVLDLRDDGVAAGQPRPDGEAQPRPAFADEMSVNPPPPADQIIAVPLREADPIPVELVPEVAVVPEPPLPRPEAMPANTLPEDQLTHTGGTGVALIRGRSTGVWRMLPVGTELVPGDEFASPVPFRAEFSLEEELNVVLEPGSRVKRDRRIEAADLQLTPRQGQMVLVRPLISEREPVVGLDVNGELWLIKLMVPGTRVGVEVIPPEPTGPPGQMGPLFISGGLTVAAGSVAIQRPGLEPVELGMEEGRIPWAEAGQPLMPQSGVALPPWLTLEGVPVTPAARQVARMYEREFLDDRPAVQSIAPVVSDRRAAISELAVRTLSLMGQYKDLVPALKAEHEESRLAAISGLRQWLVEDPSREPALREEVARSFRENNVDTVVRLLWGFSADNLRQEAVSRQLIEWMKDDEIAIRELAFYQVAHGTGRRFDYRAGLPPAERRAAILRWENHLRSTGALIDPKSAP